MKPFKLFAAVQPGLEPYAQQELAALGIKNLQPEKGGINFVGHYTTLFKVHAWCRTISRILVRQDAFHASSFWELERHAARMPWRQLLGSPRFCLRVHSYHSRLYHEDAIAQRLQKIIEAAVPGCLMTARQESADDQLIVVVVQRDEVQISLDASGMHLHKRGYMPHRAKAPLRETIAAAMILASGWDGSVPLWDLMCGGGTIPLEAAMMAQKIPLQNFRSYSYQQWKDFPAQRYQQFVQENQQPSSTSAPILGSDILPKNIDAARYNAAHAHLPAIQWQEKDIYSIDVTDIPMHTCILSNPPYGKRIAHNFAPLHTLLASWKKQRPDLTIGVLMMHDVLKSYPDLLPRFSVSNGGLLTQFVLFT